MGLKTGFENDKMLILGTILESTSLGVISQFNTSNLRLVGNTLSSIDSNGDILLAPSGNGQVVIGDGGLNLRSAGITRAAFTNAGHLHLLTNVDEKHTLKIKTANNLNDTGVAWENSGGSFTHTIYRTDVGSNRANLVFAVGLNTDIDLLTNSFLIHGSLAEEGKLEVVGALQIASGNPGVNKVLTSDVDGNATWTLPSAGGWTDAGATIILTNINDSVGIGESSPDTKLHVADGGSAGVVTAFAGTIATLESPGNGFLSILTPDANIRGILFGEPSSNIAGGIFYNDPGSPNGFQFRVNGNVTKMVIESDGIGMGTTNPDVTAILELKSVTKGFLGPRMTTVEIDDIASPATGLESYDTTINKKKVFTGTEFKTLLTEDIGQVRIQETFASTNVRFFGEFALPVTQGWMDTATGIATIDLVTQTVFGEVKQVVRHNDESSGATTSDIVLAAQNWTDINAFGASYGGTARLDTVDGANGFFSGLQANSAENPLATGNRRYGVLFANNVGNLRLTESDNTSNNVTMDGTGGNPLITFDEWFSWECVVPAGLGAAEFYINGILTSFIPTFLVNGGGLGTTIRVGSGSSSGTNRIVYHDNFGVTIYEETATKTLAAATMVGDVAQINIPEGKRDYTIILPDGNPRPIGAVLRLVASNLLGSISLENQNPAVPEILYNGLRTLVINVAIKETIEGINIIGSGNVYLGFQTGNIDQTKSVFAQLSSSVDQNPADTNPTVITFNTQDAISGLTHSTTVNPGEITIDTTGIYFVSPQAQVGKTTGGTKVDFDMFWQIDRGSGFTDEVNSNIKLTIKDPDITDVIVSAFTIELNAGDKIRAMQKTSTTGTGMGLKNTDPVVGPPTVPRTPSIIFTMYRVGGV